MPLSIAITPEVLSKDHDSVPRNPIIADVFHRAGLIERWGRGTNRVIEQCRAANIAPPAFCEVGSSMVVTFKVPVSSTPTLQVTPQVIKLLEAARGPRSREELQKEVGLKDRIHFQKAYLDPLLTAQWLERTRPEKPRSRLQRYQATPMGLKAIGR